MATVKAVYQCQYCEKSNADYKWNDATQAKLKTLPAPLPNVMADEHEYVCPFCNKVSPGSKLLAIN